MKKNKALYIIPLLTAITLSLTGCGVINTLAKRALDSIETVKEKDTSSSGMSDDTGTDRDSELQNETDISSSEKNDDPADGKDTDKKDDVGKDTDKKDASEEKEKPKTSALSDTDFEQKIPVTDGKERLLSKQELKMVEDDLNTVEYNGFTSIEFSSPDRIYWDEVFYNGAGLDTPDVDPDVVEAAFMEQMGWDELYTDLTWLGKEQIEDFMEETSGISAGDAMYPLSWEYMKDFDLYLFAHGDTNYMPIALDSGVISGSTLHLYYTVEDYDSNTHPFELVMEETPMGYRFISNRWTPPEGIDKAVSKIYDQVIAEYEQGIRDHLSGSEFIDKNMSPVASWTYTVNASDGRDPLELTGYYTEDLNHDGYDELIIGEITQDKIMPVFEIRSIRLGSWNRICMSTDKYQYYLTEDGNVYEYAVNGASDYESLIKERIYGAYHFLDPIEGVIRSPEDDDSGLGPYFFVRESMTPYGGDHITKEMYKGYMNKARKEYRDIPYTTFE